MASPQAVISAKFVDVVPFNRNWVWLTTASIVCADALSLGLAAVSSLLAWNLLNHDLHREVYAAVPPLIAVFLLCFSLYGLYPAVINPTRELRDVTVLVTLMYSVLGTSVFLFHSAESYSRAVFVLAWLQTLAILPLCRTLVRRALARKSWWGCPTIVFGAGETGEMVVSLLLRNPEIGLKPILVLDQPNGMDRQIHHVPVRSGFEFAAALVKETGVRHGILAIAGLSRAETLDILRQYSEILPELFVIPDFFGISSLWAEATDIAGMLAFHLQHRLLMPAAKRGKRVLDLCIVLLACIPVLPVCGLMALLIKVSSRGPVFYGHRRLGRDGRYFTAWKLRSMVVDSAAVLETHLAENEEARDEWHRNQKLQNDPRVTWIGRILRVTSLDELPQLFNVICGEMSLVGPRPIVQNEIARYGAAIELYYKVAPGITGLWQVSGRNNTTYAERIAWDEYYVRNWSPWLDLHILLRTVDVVLRREGAM